jgi:hypothetical protein
LALVLQLPNYPITQLPILFMPDPAEQLQKLYVAGFELQTFDRFPKAIGVMRDNCLAFLVPGPDGLQILGNVGWRMGESLGPLVERGGRKVFVHKEEILEATPERIAILDRFRADVKAILRGEEAPGAGGEP